MPLKAPSMKAWSRMIRKTRTGVVVGIPCNVNAKSFSVTQNFTDKASHFFFCHLNYIVDKERTFNFLNVCRRGCELHWRNYQFKIGRVVKMIGSATYTWRFKFIRVYILIWSLFPIFILPLLEICNTFSKTWKTHFRLSSVHIT